MRREPFNIGLYFQCLLTISLGGIIPSVIIMGLIMLLDNVSALMPLAIVANFITIIYWIYQLFDFRMIIPTKRNYYIYNLSAMCTYCGIAVGIRFIFRMLHITFSSLIYKIHTFMFFNFKILRYLTKTDGEYTMGDLTCNGIYAIFAVLIVVVLPLFVKKHEILGVNPIDINSKD